MIPDVRYARNGDVSIAYQVLGNGPVDLVYVPPFVSNLELQWQEPQQARYLQRLASFSRLVMFDTSEGGAMSLLFAATYPERVQALVLYGAYPRAVAAPDYPEGVSPEFAKERMEDLRTRWGQGITASVMAPERVADEPF